MVKVCSDTIVCQSDVSRTWMDEFQVKAGKHSIPSYSRYKVPTLYALRIDKVKVNDASSLLQLEFSSQPI